jgi:hypothetical protein
VRTNIRSFHLCVIRCGVRVAAVTIASLSFIFRGILRVAAVTIGTLFIWVRHTWSHLSYIFPRGRKHVQTPPTTPVAAMYCAPTADRTFRAFLRLI